MNIFEILTTIKNNNINVRPFTNYDPSNVVVRSEGGLKFKSTANEWSIHSIEYSSAGNLNLKFYIPGTIEFAGKTIQCKEIRNVTIVKNGELKQQFLQLTTNKDAQESIKEYVKNNIVDLSKFELTTVSDVNATELFAEAVKNFIKKLNKPAKPAKPERTAEEQVLANLGLSNGIFTKPVDKQTEVESNDKVTVKLAGLSTNTTKLAKTLKELNLTVESDFNKLLYNAKCLKKNIAGNYEYKVTDDITVTGTIC